MRHLTPNKGDVNGGHGRRLDFRLGNIKEEGAGVVATQNHATIRSSKPQPAAARLPFSPRYLLATHPRTSVRSKKSTHPNHVHKPLTAKHLRTRFSEIDRICFGDIVWR